MTGERIGIDGFLAECKSFGIIIIPVDGQINGQVQVFQIQPGYWGDATKAAAKTQLRWSAFWADEREEGFDLYSCLEGDDGYLILYARSSYDEEIASQAVFFPTADRPERHAADLLGLRFKGQPDSRRWTRHQAWKEGVYPLRNDDPLLPEGLSETPPDPHYPFIDANGASVVEIAVGPVHAGIIEPGHFRFLTVGETILNLEKHLGYVHKGVEKLAIGRDIHGLARLAGRVSGDTTVAHTWAACQAVEQALCIQIPERAEMIRAILAERERIANHLGDIGAICNDVGFAFAQYQFSRIKEQILRSNLDLFGHRYLMDCVVPGGVAVDLDADGINRMTEEIKELAPEVSQIIGILEDSESLEDRLMTTGRLTPDQARMLGVVGYVGKASGLDFDVRKYHPYPPYDQLEINVPSYHAGDVAARAKVRADEIQITFGLLGEMLRRLPEGPIATKTPNNEEETSGIGFIEGWRGEIVTFVRLSPGGKVARFYPRDPSWLTWPALELLIHGNIVPDFPVCNKSVNGSYSGHDL